MLDEPIDVNLDEAIDPVVNFNWHFLDPNQSIDEQISSIPAKYLDEINFD